MDTSKFLAGHAAFAGNYAVIVSEGGYAPNPAGGAMLGGLPANRRPQVAAGQRQVMATLHDCDDFVFPFTFEPTPNTPKTATLRINPSPAVPGAPTCYFLPYQQNSCTQIQLKDDADWFFTSSLSGCSVRASGSAHQPVVAHANGANIYNTAYSTGQGLAGVAGITDPDAVHAHAELHANGIAQVQITNLLQDPGAAHSGTVTKLDYAGQLTTGSMKQARKDFKLRTLEFFTSFDLDLIGRKPKMGSFVYGHRSQLTGWTFYYQSTVSIKAKTTLQKKIDTDVVLGPVVQFFP